MNKLYLGILLFCFTLLFTGRGDSLLSAQQANTMYFMERVPQSSELNPARQTQCDVYLGAPGLSSVQASFNTNGLHYNSFVTEAPGLQDSLYNFRHPEVDEDLFMDALQSHNYIKGELSTNVASIGIRLNDRNYFTFHIKEKMTSRISYPKDMFFMLTEDGNASGSLDFDGLGVEVKHYREYAFGISQKANDAWTVGIRGKLLYGKANFSSYNSFDLTANMNKWKLPSQSLKVNATIPTHEVTYDTSGNFNGLEEKEDMDVWDDYVMNNNNWGAALDFGFIYKPSDKWEIDLSVLDLGSIGWRDGTINMEQQGSVTFEGANLNAMIEKFDSTGIGGLSDSLNLSTTETNYATPLTTKIYIGGRYNVTDAVSFGLLTRTAIHRGSLWPQMTMSANYSGDFLSASLSYSMMNAQYNNFGLGLNFRVGPFNLYFITDNIPLRFNEVTPQGAQQDNTILVPYKFRDMNVRFGLNLEFGCRPDIGDYPLIY